MINNIIQDIFVSLTPFNFQVYSIKRDKNREILDELKLSGINMEKFTRALTYEPYTIITHDLRITAMKDKDITIIVTTSAEVELDDVLTVLKEIKERFFNTYNTTLKHWHIGETRDFLFFGRKIEDLLI